MTATKPNLPDHNGEPVDGAQIKFSGLGTGFNGLDVDPIYMELDDSEYFVMKATAGESPSAKRTKKGELVWLNRLTVDSMAPIDQETAERVLSEHAEKVQRRRDEIDGQLRLTEEAAALDREARDETDSPQQIAADAAERAKA